MFKSNKEVIDLLFNYGKNMESHFNRLSDLEIANNIDSEEYKKELKVISIYRNEINTLLSKNKLDIKEVLELVYFFKKELKIFDDDETIVNLAIAGNGNNSFIFLYNLFYEYFIEKNINIEDYDSPEDYINEQKRIESLTSDNEEYDDEDVIEDIEDIEEIEDEDAVSVDINEYIDEYNKVASDIDKLKVYLELTTLLSLTVDRINKEENTFVKNELIKFKYRLIYLFPILTDKFLGLPDRLYSQSMIKKLLSNYMNNSNPDINDIFFQEYSNSLLYDIEEWIAFIQNTKEEVYNNEPYNAWLTMTILSMKTNISLVIDDYQRDILVKMKRDAISEADSEYTKKLLYEVFDKTR